MFNIIVNSKLLNYKHGSKIEFFLYNLLKLMAKFLVIFSKFKLDSIWYSTHVYGLIKIKCYGNFSNI